MTCNILLLCGGDGSEHDISVLSANYIQEQLELTENFNVIKCLIHNHKFFINGDEAFFKGTTLICENNEFKIDCVVPCLHGYPGETGDIQSYLELLNIP